MKCNGIKPTTSNFESIKFSSYVVIYELLYEKVMELNLNACIVQGHSDKWDNVFKFVTIENTINNISDSFGYLPKNEQSLPLTTTQCQYICVINIIFKYY